MKTAVWMITAMMVAAATWAQPGGGGKQYKKGGDGAGRGMHAEQMAEQLGLSDGQADALRDLQHDWQSQQIDLRAASQKTKLELRNRMRDPQSTRDEIIKAVEADAAADLAMAKARVEHFLKVRELLGPEKAAQLHEMCGGPRDEQRGPGGPPFPRDGKNQGPEGDRPR